MKRLLGLMMCSIIGLTASAQKQNLSFGPSAGFGHAWMSNVNNSKYKPAGNVGVNLTYSSAPHLGFGTGLKYSIEGSKSKTGNNEYEATLDYLRIPLKVMYFFGDYGDRVRPKIAAGPSFGFLVGGNYQVTQNGVEGPKVKVKDVYKGFDLGLTVSAGLNYRLVKNTWFVADVNYYNGFSDVTESSLNSLKNRNIGLNIGVNFGIGTAK